VAGIERLFVADATPLIALARIGRLDLLDVLPVPILVAVTVWNEVAGDLSRPGAVVLERARDDGILAVIDAGDAHAYLQLGPGENATITAAAEIGAAVIVDERKARRLLREDPELRGSIPAILSTVALVILEKRAGVVPDVRVILHQLQKQGFYIGQSVYEAALRSSGEL
jgi:predicted nucleic acid-binding protein